MRLILLLLLIVLVPGCIGFEHNSADNHKIIEVGSLTSDKIWIYLCGLTKDLDTAQEIENRDILNHIGQELNIKFLALQPKDRCSDFDNKLCWPHNSAQEALDTYNYILNNVNNNRIDGFIGFSNGGFFLNKLAQIVELNKPIISIGSAGYLADGRFKNNMYLLIGKQDVHHYNGAQQFYSRSKGTALNVKLIEYSGGHEISKQIVKNVLTDLYEQSQSL